MKDLPVTIKLMARGHIPACTDIVRTSAPWTVLRENVDFIPAIRMKQAFVALIGGAVAGFVVFTPGPVFARGGYLRAIGVAPAIRGSGIGRQLLKFAEKATAKQASYLFLCVSSFNKSGQAFYKKLGYAKAGKLDNLIKKGLSEYIYWKRLK
jgi:ribosomal protein S18 acetylase RimI-like enzyme